MVPKKIAAFAGSLAFLALPQTASAADYTDWPDGLRGSYDWNDSSQNEDVVGFEAGLRYYLSAGGQSFSVGPTTETSSDVSHILEAHVRINDNSTSSFLRANAGYAIATTGEYSGDWSSGSIVDGTIGYIGGDLGQFWFGDARKGFGIGGFIGYQYLHDNPDMGRANFTTASSVNDITWSTTSTYWTVPFDSQPNNFDVHMLRLGATMRSEINDMADISLDLAAIPYANISGTLGSFGVSSFIDGGATYVQSSAADINGWGYGAAADLMFGFHPTDNMVVRLGGRARYIQGIYDSTYSMAAITDQADANTDGTYETAPIYTNQNYIDTNNAFSMWRLGGLFELTASF